MVAVRCKACQHVTVGKRTPARCQNCGAKYAVVGGELCFDTKSKSQKIAAKAEPVPAPKSAAKKLEITPKTIPKVEKPPEPAKEEPLECANCGARLTKGQERCNVCGVALDWENVGE